MSIPAPSNQRGQALVIISRAAREPRGSEVDLGSPNHTMTAIHTIASIAQATQTPTKTRPIRSQSSNVFNGGLIVVQVSLEGRTQTADLSDAGNAKCLNSRCTWPARFAPVVSSGGILLRACSGRIIVDFAVCA